MFIRVSTALFFVALSFGIGINAEEPQTIGSFYQCAHDFRGKVWIKNDREILIEGLNYDGKGPAAWFHGQLKPAPNGIQTTDATTYVTLPYPDASCDRLKVGRTYKDENVTLILPRSVKDFATIGIFCYQYCHNFGHIVIPDTLNVPAAPENLQTVNECPKPDYAACKNPRNGALHPDCTAGASNTNMAPSGATQITFISTWVLLSLFLFVGRN